MASFSEYAALARHLHDLRRAGERTAAQVAEHRGSTGAAVDRLDQRLAIQQQRLTALGQMIGKPVPVGPSAPLVGEALPPEPPRYAPPASGGHPTVPAQYAGPDQLDRPIPFDRSNQPPAQSGPPNQAGQSSQFGPPTPFGPPVQYGGRGQSAEAGSGELPVGQAYPELPAGQGRRALPGSPAGGQVPGPRLPFDQTRTGPGQVPGAAMPPARPVDPRRELELARQAADGADVMIVQAETMAQQAPLLPSMSALARAMTVYFGCAGVLAVIIWILLTVSEVQGSKGLDRNTVAVFSWSCAGLPTMLFFVGYFVLGVWGKPRIIVGRPARYARLGFLICFLASPIAFLAYYLVLM